MGIHVIKMPDIGEGIAEVELVAWRVQPGETVAEDQILADVMTDKATVEIPSPVVGTVLALGGEVGEVLAVGAELIRIEVADGGAKAATAPQSAASTMPASTTATIARSSPVPASQPAALAAPARPVPAALAHSIEVRDTTPLARATAARGDAGKPIASPALRRRAWELGIDLHHIAGSGPGGRIMEADLSAAVAAGVAAKPSRAPGPPAAAPARADLAVRVTGLRRKIAQKMQESKRRIPHYTYVEEVDVTEIEGLRVRLNARWEGERGRLTLLPFLVRAIGIAVREFPQMNARFDDEAGIVTQFGAVHIGIATQTRAGLMVPVLRDADRNDLWANAAEIARLAGVARSGKATRDELRDSTITLTSLGALGGIVTTPVINHPEVAIVGVNRIVARPVVRDGAVVVRQMMNLSSSFDHRVVDGVHAAEFVQALRGLLESPGTLFVE